MLLVARPGAPSSVLAPTTGASSFIMQIGVFREGAGAGSDIVPARGNLDQAFKWEPRSKQEREASASMVFTSSC